MYIIGCMNKNGSHKQYCSNQRKCASLMFHLTCPVGKKEYWMDKVFLKIPDVEV